MESNNLLKINDGFYFNIDIKDLRNKGDEERITFTGINFMSSQTVNIDEDMFKDQLTKSMIYIQRFQSLKQYSISSMILPWFDDIILPNTDVAKRTFLFDLLCKIILRIIHYYYYIKSAEDFQIIPDVIFEIKKVKKAFITMFFDHAVKEENKVMQYLFFKLEASGNYQLINDIFDSINSDDKKYLKLHQVSFIYIQIIQLFLV
jgi:hypothetical protein